MRQKATHTHAHPSTLTPGNKEVRRDLFHEWASLSLAELPFSIHQHSNFTSDHPRRLAASPGTSSLRSSP